MYYILRFTARTTISVYVHILIYNSLFIHIQCRCTTIFLTTCEKVADVSRYGHRDWTNLSIVSSVYNNHQPLNQTLRYHEFNTKLNLEQIYIEKQITNIEAGAFDGLNKLTYIKLHKNIIPVLPRGAFSNLTNLLKLDLQNNAIENIDHESFANSLITTIDLSGNKLSNIKADQLNLPSLKTLNLAHNELFSIAPNSFNENLESLNLNDNELVETDGEVFKNLQNLKELILSRNSLDYVNFPYGLRNLETLDLSHNGISRIRPGCFHNFTELKYLYLGNNSLTHISETIFPKENPLQLLVVYVHQNKLVNLGYGVADRLPALQEMSIGGNPWDCTCLALIEEYINRRKLRHFQYDVNMYKGNSATCIYINDNATCTGTEKLTEELYNQYLQNSIVYDCY